MIATDGRQAFRHFVGRLAKDWPKDLSSAGLWKIIEELIGVAWSSASTDWDYNTLIIWDDLGQPDLSQRPEFRNAVNRYKEWVEGILLLGTAVDLASLVVGAHSELIPNLNHVLDQRLFNFIKSDGANLASVILRETQGSWRPFDEGQRNTRLLIDSVAGTFTKLKDDDRLEAWSKQWAEYFLN